MTSGAVPVDCLSLTPDRVTDALGSVLYPGLTRDLVSFGMVQHVSVCDDRVKVQLSVRTTDAEMPARLTAAVEAALLPMGAASVAVEIVAPAPQPRPAAHGTPDPWSGQVRLASVRHVVAVAEARKAAEMFRALEVPVLGIVENMSGPFGRGAGRAVADSLGVSFLGEVPFDEIVVAEGDRGTPTMRARPESPTARAFDHVAAGVAGALGWRREEALSQ
jgi:metal-sulfur cluster biosynthetic enzyme